MRTRTFLTEVPPMLSSSDSSNPKVSIATCDESSEDGYPHVARVVRGRPADPGDSVPSDGPAWEEEMREEDDDDEESSEEEKEEARTQGSGSIGTWIVTGDVEDPSSCPGGPKLRDTPPRGTDSERTAPRRSGSSKNQVTPPTVPGPIRFDAGDRNTTFKVGRRYGRTFWDVATTDVGYVFWGSEQTDPSIQLGIFLSRRLLR